MSNRCRETPKKIVLSPDSRNPDFWQVLCMVWTLYIIRTFTPSSLKPMVQPIGLLGNVKPLRDSISYNQ